MSTRSGKGRWFSVALWIAVGGIAATVWFVGTGVVRLGSADMSVFDDVATALPPEPDVPAAADAVDDLDLFGDRRDVAFKESTGGARESAAPQSPPPRNYADMSEGEIRPGQALPAPSLGSAAPTAGSPVPLAPPQSSTPPAEPVDLLAEVDRKLAALELGNIAFNTPDTIPLGDAATIELLVSLREAADELRRAVRGPGAVETARVQISDQMEARLTGLGFRIEAVTPERQAISRAERTRWQWQIEPTKPERLALHLTLSAVIKIDGIPSTRSIRTFEKTVYVEVPLSRRVADMLAGNLELISTVVLIPIFGGLWRYHRRRKRRLAQAAGANSTRRAA